MGLVGLGPPPKPTLCHYEIIVDNKDLLRKVSEQRRVVRHVAVSAFVASLSFIKNQVVQKLKRFQKPPGPLARVSAPGPHWEQSLQTSSYRVALSAGVDVTRASAEFHAFRLLCCCPVCCATNQLYIQSARRLDKPPYLTLPHITLHYLTLRLGEQPANRPLGTEAILDKPQLKLHFQFPISSCSCFTRGRVQ